MLKVPQHCASGYFEDKRHFDRIVLYKQQPATYNVMISDKEQS
jgi:hypothetical protein